MGRVAVWWVWPVIAFTASGCRCSFSRYAGGFYLRLGPVGLAVAPAGGRRAR